MNGALLREKSTRARKTFTDADAALTVYDRGPKRKKTKKTKKKGEEKKRAKDGVSGKSWISTRCRRIPCVPTRLHVRRRPRGDGTPDESPRVGSDVYDHRPSLPVGGRRGRRYGRGPRGFNNNNNNIIRRRGRSTRVAAEFPVITRAPRVKRRRIRRFVPGTPSASCVPRDGRTGTPTPTRRPPPTPPPTTTTTPPRDKYPVTAQWSGKPSERTGRAL